MIHPSPLRRITSSLLIITFLVSAGRELGAGSWTTAVGGAALTLFILLEWPGLALISRLTFSVAIATLAAFTVLDLVSLELIEKAFARATFFAFFVTALDILRSAAQTSPMIRTCGKLIVDQPPGRRYGVLTFGGHLFGILLNMGSLNLLGTMVRRSIDTDQTGVEQRIRDIRLQRMTMALMRGFCAIPLWAPTSVSVIIVLTGLPDVSWFDAAPYAMTTAFTFIMLGWLVDRMSFPRPAIKEAPGSLITVLLALLPLLLLNIIVLGTAFTISQITSLRLIAALLICIPVFGMGWIVLQYARAGGLRALQLTQRRLWNRIFPAFSDVRSEIGILASSAFLSVILLPQIDVAALSNFIALHDLGQSTVLILTFWTIVLLAPMGINPIITVLLAVDILATLPGQEISPYLILFVCTMGWTLVTGFSPFAAALRLVCRCINISPLRVGLVWNRVFSLCVFAGASLYLLIIA
ncbi:MAG: hypothetical protein HOE62_14065 [Alphaproteobacteria bacterium]|jgi:hypothetical protein|nr:hypothetical protein [Alphaproteobacteria bacterium]MBT4019073.1 hypothetical protein [Alphaproteobacteria bacterium]MBT4966474.1 hypothetical protein [Alphaproteobacteria bacterium]MBT5159091.1 hypothetical protein [Alphaproteobacteria bacterium]MBT5918837.1 hypothetical protein [Alphaproteobacteria bacterium]